ncbi:hypothetical protein DNTS_018905 [Danionella cerebrum]|uniref:Uncharacterized protein n=1 Tax=Danionella cerebrum TaxID=2873325 RepID=A0A553RKH8_9TELE|nr:hypothetical protein DNTS_018905 [Danionella translucida]
MWDQICAAPVKPKEDALFDEVVRSGSLQAQFSIDLALMHFQCPSVCAGGVGAPRVQSSHSLEEFTLKGSMEGGVLLKERHSSEKLDNAEEVCVCMCLQACAGGLDH